MLLGRHPPFVPDAPPAPSFPTAGVAAKALELGFGSGPWSRSELAGRWSDSTANKFINDAKSAGWLISPFRDEFYVLPARDLAVVGWLPAFEREEFVVSRMLATLGIRYWCLSEWARRRGLLFPQPLFVTDLADLPDPDAFPAPMLSPPGETRLAQAVARRASSWPRLPFLEHLVIVPTVPQTSRWPRAVRAVLPLGFPQKGELTAWALEASPSGTDDPTSETRAIPYPLAPDVDDPAWTAALVFSLGLPRVDELLDRALQEAVAEEPRVRKRAARKGRKPPPLSRRFERWAGLLGPPAGNASWRERVPGGSPYLLVPSSLAAGVASAARARRFEDLRQVREWFDARA